MKDATRDIVDNLWQDLIDRYLLDQVDADDQLRILMTWYDIVEGTLDGYDATIK